MFLQWNITIPYYNVTNTRVISAFNTVGHVTPLQVPSVVITFTIPSTSPLTSELSVNSATVNLNDTKFECTERDTEMDRSNETWLYVINITQGKINFNINSSYLQINDYVDFPHLAMIRHRSEEFGTENVTVTLKLLHLDSKIVSYDVSIIPPSISTMWLTGNTSVQLLLLYNTPYYLSVNAILCGQTSETTITRLSYGKY